MTRQVARGRTGALLHFRLDRRGSGAEHLNTQIYRQIRQRIESGVLGLETALPSTRTLAGDLNVARSTVVQAYAQLQEEGFVVLRRGASPRVRREPSPSPPPRLLPPNIALRGSISRRGARLVACANPTYPLLPRTPRAFRHSVPALDLFPVAIWERLISRILRRTPAQALSYGDARGLRELREAIADHLGVRQGISCTPDQVLVTQGSQQAIALAGMVLTDPGDDVLVEEPGYFAARGAMLLAGANPVSVPVDLRGADLARALRAHPAARLAVLTPGRHLPLGVSLSAERRDLVMDWANREGRWVVEDDYAADLRQASETPPLRARPDGASVIYAGTFSKVLFPSLRLGYLVLPDALVEPFARARTFLDFHPPYLEQAVTAAFLAEGHFERHVRRVRTALQARRQLLKDALAGPLRGLAEIDAPDGFWHMLVQLPPRWSGEVVSSAAASRGIDVMPLSRFTASGKAPSALLLGFSGLREDELRTAAETLVTLIRDLARTGAALASG